MIAKAVMLAAWVGALAGAVHEKPVFEEYTMAMIEHSYRDGGGTILREKSEWGKFGEGHVGPGAGLLGHPRIGHDDTGCRFPMSTRPPPPRPWVALLRRGGCNFQIKVDNAYRSNASAVIVFDDRYSNNVEKMRLTPRYPGNISAVFTYRWKGEELIKLLRNGTQISVEITVGTHYTKTLSQISRTSVLFVSISFVVLMVVSLAWLVFYYVQRFRQIHAKDRLSRLCSAARRALSQIPTKLVQPEDKEMEGEGECCAICIEPFKPDEILRILPCRHEFHMACIDPWLLEHRTCPMCKMDILRHYGFVFTGSQESILDIDPEEMNSDSDSMDQENVGPISDVTPSEVQVSIVERIGEIPEIQDRSLQCDLECQIDHNLASGSVDDISSEVDPSSEELLSTVLNVATPASERDAEI